MRIASGLLALILMVFLGIQSLLIYAGTGITGQAKLSEAAAMGLFGSFLFLVGGAFAFKLPTVAAVIFAVAALILLAGASVARYPDLYIWMGAAILLCLLAIGGRFELRRKRKRDALAQQQQVQLMAQQFVEAQQAAQDQRGTQPQM